MTAHLTRAEAERRIAENVAWRTPQQLAARRAQRQRRIAKRCAFEAAGCAPSQATMDAIADELRATLKTLESNR